MGKDNIIRMAIQCQLVTTSNRDGIYMDALERFAQLIAAAKAKEIADKCEKLPFGDTAQSFAIWIREQ